MENRQSSVWESEGHVIALARVQHVEKCEDGAVNVVMDSTRWDWEHECWENAVYLEGENAQSILEAFKAYWEGMDDE